MPAPRNSGGAWYFFIRRDFRALRQRMERLREIGAKYVRLWFPWSQIETREGYVDFSYLDDAIATIVSAGLKLDVTLCPLMAPPWFWERYPDALMLNHLGRAEYKPSPTAVQSAPISYWHPELRPRYQGFIDQCFTKCLDSWAPFIHYHRVSMGRLNEPTYPNKRYFWCYDKWALRAFRRRMKERYGDDLQALNEAWQTDLNRFRAIAVPRPDRFAAMTSRHRADFIHWYRDSKDEFVLWVLERLKARLQPYQKIVLFPAGSGDADGPIERFIDHAEVTPELRHMERNFWLLALCQEDQQLCAQFAGVGIKSGPRTFAARLMRRYREQGYSFPFYAQIPGLETRDRQPNHPDEVARAIVKLGYHGFAWNKDSDLYRAPTVPHERLTRLAKGFRLIEKAYPADYSNPVISAVRVAEVTGTSARVRWTTDKPCDAVVLYGKNSGFLKRVSTYDRTPKRRHAIRLDGLRPAFTYYFTAASADDSGNFTCSPERSFTTGSR